MIQLTELHFSLSLCVMFFIGAILTAVTAIIVHRIRMEIKEDEISELVRKIAGNELDRREGADSLRKVSLKYINLKQKIRIILKKYKQLSKSQFGKSIREVINGK